MPAGVDPVTRELLEANREEAVTILTQAPGRVLVHTAVPLSRDDNFGVWRLACVRWGLNANTACLPSSVALLATGPSRHRPMSYGDVARSLHLDERPSDEVLEAVAVLASSGMTLPEVLAAAQAL